MALSLERAAVVPHTSWRDLLALTRPGVLLLVVLTGPAGFTLGAASTPPLWVMLGVLIGTGLLAGGCSAFNAVWERERDARMARTRERPLPSGRLSQASACFFATGLTIVGLGMLLGLGGPLSALIGAATWLHYVGVYTIWLKPRTAQSIVIGGAAGATAPLIADAAVDGVIGPWSMLLFLIIVLWTPAHFWAIALMQRVDYSAAGFPVMPAVVGEQGTRWRMLGYGLATLMASMLPLWFGLVGWAAVVIALGVNLGFVGLLLRALWRRSREADRAVFIGSVVQMAVLFAALTVG